MRLRILHGALLPACLFFAAQSTQAAFTIEPAIITFFVDRGEKAAYVELVHSGGDPAAVQMSVHERKLDINGEFIMNLGAKSPDFIVHPAQAILYPKERATVQIQYRSKGKITADRAFVLHSQEVPINVAK